MPTLRILDLYAQSQRKPNSTCWWWTGGTSAGRAQIWGLDLDRMCKRAMRAPRAVWFITHGQPLGPHRVAYMSCQNPLCVNPLHTLAGTRTDIGAAVRRTGRAKTAVAYTTRVANARKARAIQGMVETPKHIVLAIREHPRTVTHKAVAELYGLKPGAVARIRAGIVHRDVLPAKAAA